MSRALKTDLFPSTQGPAPTNGTQRHLENRMASLESQLGKMGKEVVKLLSLKEFLDKSLEENKGLKAELSLLKIKMEELAHPTLVHTESSENIVGAHQEAQRQIFQRFEVRVRELEKVISKQENLLFNYQATLQNISKSQLF